MKEDRVQREQRAARRRRDHLGRQHVGHVGEGGAVQLEVARSAVIFREVRPTRFLRVGPKEGGVLRRVRPVVNEALAVEVLRRDIFLHCQQEVRCVSSVKLKLVFEIFRRLKSSNHEFGPRCEGLFDSNETSARGAGTNVSSFVGEAPSSGKLLRGPAVRHGDGVGHDELAELDVAEHEEENTERATRRSP